MRGFAKANDAAARVRVSAALLALALSAVAPGAQATLPKAGWLPMSQGLVPMSGSTTNTFVPPYNYWITRLRPDAAAPGRLFASDRYHGLYVYEGAAWKSLTPGCLIDASNPLRAALLSASGLGACGIIDIAIDPAEPRTLYVSAVSPAGTLGSPRFEAGGVFRSDNAGATWTRVSPAFRGGGLAVARSGSSVVIVAGSFQRSSREVGTATSLMVSTNGGATWAAKSLPAPSGCPANEVAVSSRLVATVAFHPTNPNIVYAGTNAGLYKSATKGASWSLALKACGLATGIGYIGGAWGIDFAPNGSKVYSAAWDGTVRSATPGSTAWTTIKVLPATHLRDLIVDARDPSILFASAFGKSKAGAKPGVYRIVNRAPSSFSLLGDNALANVNQAIGGGRQAVFLVNDAWTLSLAQHPLQPDLLYTSHVLNGVFVRSEG